MRQAGLPEVL
jgi:hypothetical protein